MIINPYIFSSAPIAPTLVEQEPTFNSIQLTWASVPTATLYDFEYKESTSGTWLGWGDNTSPVIVTGLIAETSYDCRVRAFNGVWGPYSATLTVETGFLHLVFGDLYGRTSSFLACSGTPNDEFYFAGQDYVPQTGDIFYTDSTGSTIFNGGNLWYYIGDSGSSIQIATNGAKLDESFCF